MKSLVKLLVATLLATGWFLFAGANESTSAEAPATRIPTTESMTDTSTLDAFTPIGTSSLPVFTCRHGAKDVEVVLAADGRAHQLDAHALSLVDDPDTATLILRLGKDDLTATASADHTSQHIGVVLDGLAIDCSRNPSASS
ncbi:MAG: hypothetical protein AAGD38_19120 [Acidobacteriota bacterium]